MAVTKTKKPKYEVEIGEAEISPSYSVEMGEAEIEEPGELTIESHFEQAQPLTGPSMEEQEHFEIMRQVNAEALRRALRQLWDRSR